LIGRPVELIKGLLFFDETPPGFEAIPEIIDMLALSTDLPL
jgi:hypothetical protein